MSGRGVVLIQIKPQKNTCVDCGSRPKARPTGIDPRRRPMCNAEGARWVNACWDNVPRAAPVVSWRRVQPLGRDATERQSRNQGGNYESCPSKAKCLAAAVVARDVRRRCGELKPWKPGTGRQPPSRRFCLKRPRAGFHQKVMIVGGRRPCSNEGAGELASFTSARSGPLGQHCGFIGGDAMRIEA